MREKFTLISKWASPFSRKKPISELQRVLFRNFLGFPLFRLQGKTLTCFLINRPFSKKEFRRSSRFSIHQNFGTGWRGWGTTISETRERSFIQKLIRGGRR